MVTRKTPSSTAPAPRRAGATPAAKGRAVAKTANAVKSALPAPPPPAPVAEKKVAQAAKAVKDAKDAKDPKAGKVGKAEKAPKAAKPDKTAKAEKAPKPPKLRPRLVRDGFTMPEADFSLIGTLKARALAGAHPAKKSELLRAGLHALAALDTPALVAALARLEPVKTGRPAKGG